MVDVGVTHALGMALGEESPSTVTASFEEWPDSMALPLALVDVTDAARKGCHDPSGATGEQSNCASRKAAGRHDTPVRPTNLGSSAAEIWGQCLSEWRASNPEAAASTVTPKRAAHTPTVFPKQPVARKPKASGPRSRPDHSRPGPRPYPAVGEDIASPASLGVTPPAGHTKEELMQLVQLVDACAIGGAHCSSCNLWRTLRAADQPIKV